MKSRVLPNQHMIDISIGSKISLVLTNFFELPSRHYITHIGNLVLLSLLPGTCQG